MLQISTRLSHVHHVPNDSVTLDYDTRQKARIKITTDKGLDAGIFIERGKPLLINEVLKSDCGQHVQVLGALEPVTTASCDDWLTFAKVCYHLGNRHTKLQVGERWLRFKPDHVLSELVQQLGCSVSDESAIFEPENGAYNGLSVSGHNHGHAHHNDDHHGHDH
ncbi:urease accessory protein UreE [Paraglaciecola hydrolytica]|uniref:Urease accessory protein UreE n=1 Tax=Paraglaciecola hydrolytica TaxID=1799789 RepID=A0A136A4P3_9ALTE|nr:urease accessory protein UreE [Paraglaciecola hydrolytica]KXI30203.1 urease accessory protein UreE [Paraglaciecola hydrolytica]